MTRLRRFIRLMVALVSVMLLGTPVAAQDQQPPDPPATALRVAIDRALGEHAFLVGEVVRSGIAAGPEFDAAAATLDQNSADIVAVMTDVHGADAGKAFEEQWSNHVAYIVDYGRALAEGDADAAQLASEQLDRYVADFGRFLADAMPVLPSETVQGLIGEHVQQLQHVASFEEADFGGAYDAIRETYAHMFAVGDGLAVGIISRFPDRFTGRFEAFSPATDFRLRLDRELGEHSYLAALAMRAVLRGSADSRSALDALAGNSADLRATLAEVYGSGAGEAFAALWDGHVTAYADYVAALADDDEAAGEAALAALAEYRAEFSAYVTEANPFLSRAAFEALIGEHTEHLVAQADAYAAGDYETSYSLGREAFAHAGELSRSLAGAIADQFPRLFPDTAGPVPNAPIGLVGGALLAAGVLFAAVRVRAWRR